MSQKLIQKFSRFLGINKAQKLIQQEKKEKTGKLDLGNCGLTKIPDEIFELTWLEELSFCNEICDIEKGKVRESNNEGKSNNILNEKLPLKFKNLKNLEKLYYGGDFSSGRWELKNLNILSELKNLRTLYLSRNKIEDIKPLEHLTELNELDLGYNQIDNIEPLESLEELKYLSLDKNKISDINPLENLTNLNSLFLRKNSINIIPRKIADLSKLKSFNVNNNPILTPPIEIAKQGIDSIKKWYEAEREQLNEIKISLLGDGKVGKTSLLRRLKYDEFNENEKSTEGINIDYFNFSEMDTFTTQTNLEGITGVFWDFGGQEIMSSTHKFFMTKRTIYILVCEARKDGQLDINISDWIKKIQTYAGNSKVIVAINKIDKTSAYSLNKYELKNGFPQIVNIIDISCKERTNIYKLKDILEETIPEAELFNKKIDERWIKLKDILRSKAEDDFYLSKDTVINICEKECKIGSEESQLEAVKFLNDLGIVLHFDDIHMDEFFIFDPEWVTSGIYKIINSKRVSKQGGKININSDLAFIVNKEKNKAKNYYIPEDKKNIRYSSNEMLYLLRIMEQFELGYFFDNNTKFLVPDLLPNEQPKGLYENIIQDNNSLQLVYRFEYLPKSIIHRLIIKLRKDIKEMWRNGIILKSKMDNNAKALVASKENYIKIAVLGTKKAKREYLSVIRYFLNNLCSTYQIQPKKLVPLPNYNKYVEYDKLIKMENEGRNIYEDWNIDEKPVKFKINRLLEGIEPIEQLNKDGPRVEQHYHDHTHVYKGGKNMRIEKINANDNSQITISDYIEKVSMENSNISPEQLEEFLSVFSELDSEEKKQVKDDILTLRNEKISENEKESAKNRIKQKLKKSVPFIKNFSTAMLVELGKHLAKQGF